MRDRFLALWRTAAQAGFSLTLAYLVGHGIHINAHWSSVVEVAVIAGGAGVWAYGTHWLQTRTGNRWWAKLARGAGRVLVLGAAALPSYATPKES